MRMIASTSTHTYTDPKELTAAKTSHLCLMLKILRWDVFRFYGLIPPVVGSAEERVPRGRVRLTGHGKSGVSVQLPRGC